MQSTHITSAPSEAVELTQATLTSQVIGHPLAVTVGLPHNSHQKYNIQTLTSKVPAPIVTAQQINGHATQLLSPGTPTSQPHVINHTVLAEHHAHPPPNHIEHHTTTEVLLSPLPDQATTLAENTSSNTTVAVPQDGAEVGYSCGLVCSKVFKTTDELTKHFLQDHVENYTSALKGSSLAAVANNQENKSGKFSGNTLMSNLLAMASGQTIKPVNRDSKRLTGKTYDCDVCNKKFGRLADLSRHLLVHSGVKPYRCNMCEKAYRNSGDLKTHMNMHAGIRPYGCAVCQRSFTARGVLARHMRTHTGERPYSCFVCAKAFADRRSRHDHILTHTGEKPHQCSICGKNFLQSSTLRTHVKTQHAALTGIIKQDVHEAAMGALKPDLQDSGFSAIKNEMMSPGLQSPTLHAHAIQPAESPNIQSPKPQTSIIHPHSIEMATVSTPVQQHTLPVSV